MFLVGFLTYARVNPGETVLIYTKDAFGNRIIKESDVSREILGDYLIPQTGSIFIEGVELGDTLVAIPTTTSKFPLSKIDEYTSTEDTKLSNTNTVVSKRVLHLILQFM